MSQLSLVTNPGSYRAKVLDHAVNVSSGGHPQLVLSLELTQAYDFDTQTWVDWSQYGEGATAYLILAGKEQKATKNAEQAQKVFKWDGMSFAGLDTLPLDGQELQVRIVAEEYNGQPQKKVAWIDLPDAKPSAGLGMVDKLGADKLKALDKQFQGMLKGLSGGKIATAKFPATPPAAPKPGIVRPAVPAPVAPDDAVPVEEPSANTDVPDPDSIPAPAPTAPKPPVAPKKMGRPPKAPAAPAPAKQYDQNSAWAAIVAQTEGVDDGARAEAWSGMLEHIAPGKDEKQITQPEWEAIVTNTVKECKE